MNAIHLCKGTVPQLCSLNVPVNDLCIHCIFIKDIKKICSLDCIAWLTTTEYLCHKWPLICSVCRYHNLVLSSFVTYHWVCNKSYVHVEQELLSLPEHLRSPRIFCEVRLGRSVVFCVVFCRSLFVLLFFFCCPLCHLFFNLRLLITTLVYSNLS